MIRPVLGPGLCQIGLGLKWAWPGLAGRPDLAQARARSGLDLFILVEIKSSNFLFEPEYTDTGSFYSGAASMEVLPE